MKTGKQIREVFWRDKNRQEPHVWYLRADLSRPMEQGPYGAYDGWQLRLYPAASKPGFWDVSFSRGYALKGGDGWGYTGGKRSHPDHFSVSWLSPIGEPLRLEAAKDIGLYGYLKSREIFDDIVRKLNRRWPDLGLVGARSNPTEPTMQAEIEEFDRRDGSRFFAVNFYDNEGTHLATVSFESVGKDIYTALIWYGANDQIRFPFSTRYDIDDKLMRKIGLRGWMFFEPAMKLAFGKVRGNHLGDVDESR